MEANAGSAFRHARPTLYTADWVLPIVSPPIRLGAVLVADGKIAWVGPRAAAPVGDLGDGESGDVAVEDMGRSVLMPGLVNAHSHLELTTLRGLLEGLDFREWLQTLTALRRDLLTSDDLADAARVGIAEALRHGITTLADTTDSAAPLHAMREMGVRGVGYVEVFGPDPVQCDAAMHQLRGRVESLRRLDTSLVRVGISPHAPYTVSAALFRAAAEMARVEGLPLAVHIAESGAEERFVRHGEGPFAARLRARNILVAPQARSSIALLKACGVLDVQPLLIHAIRVDDEDLRAIAAARASIVHCPISNLKLGHGVAPLDRMLAHGVRVGLGTDSVASNDRMHLVDEARQAILLHALRSEQPDSLDAHAALSLATLGGAAALGMEERIGTLEPGKAADLAAFPFALEETGPVYDPAVTLVHVLAGRAVASLVTVAGVLRWRDGYPTAENRRRVDDSRRRLVAAAERIKEWRRGGSA